MYQNSSRKHSNKTKSTSTKILANKQKKRTREIKYPKAKAQLQQQPHSLAKKRCAVFAQHDPSSAVCREVKSSKFLE